MDIEQSKVDDMPRKPAPQSKVFVFGDSIAVEIEEFLGKRISIECSAKGGSRFCHVLKQMNKHRDSSQILGHPAIVIVMTGANDKGCMLQESMKYAPKIVEWVKEFWPSASCCFLRPGWSTANSMQFVSQHTAEYLARLVEHEPFWIMRDIDMDQKKIEKNTLLCNTLLQKKRKFGDDEKAAMKKNLHYRIDDSYSFQKRIIKIIEEIVALRSV